MNDTQEVELLPVEKQAVALFQTLGRSGVLDRINTLGREAETRQAAYVAARKWGFDDSNHTAHHYLSDAEKEEWMLLQLGLSLCIDAQAEARERILARRKARMLRQSGKIPCNQLQN